MAKALDVEIRIGENHEHAVNKLISKECRRIDREANRHRAYGDLQEWLNAIIEERRRLWKIAVVRNLFNRDGSPRNINWGCETLCDARIHCAECILAHVLNLREAEFGI